MSNVLASLSVRLLGDIGGFVESMEKAVTTADSAGSGIAGKLGGALAAVGKAAAGIAVAGVDAAAKAMIGSITAANGWAKQLDDLGDVLGTTASDSAALSVAIMGVGGDVGAVTTQMAFMSKGLKDEKGELGATGLALQKLGITAFETGKSFQSSAPAIKMTSSEMADLNQKIEMSKARYADMGAAIAKSKNPTEAQRVAYRQLGDDIAGMTSKLKGANTMITKTLTSEGPLKDSAKLLHEVATKIDAMPDGLEKTSTMMAVFGKSGKDLSDTLHAIAGGGLEEARKKAKLYGLDIGEDGVNASIAFGKGMANIQMMGQGLAVTIGSQLLPVVVPFIEKFILFAQSVMPQVSAGISTALPIIAALVTGITTGTGQFGEIGVVLGNVVATIRTVLGQVIAWVVANWPQISATIGAVLSGIGAFVTTYVVPALGLIVAAIGAVIGWVRENWPTIQYVVGQVFDGIKKFAETVLVPALEFVIKQVGVVVAWVKENWPLIQATAEKVFNAIKTVIEVVAPVLEQVIGGTFQSIKAIIETVIWAVLGIIKTVMQIINGDWEGAWQSINGVVETIWTGIKNFFGGLPAQVLQFGINIINGLVDGIRNSASMVLGALSDVVNNAINGVKATLGIHSPSTVFAGFGENMMRGLADGIDSFGSLPTVSVRGVVGGFTGNATATGSAPANPFSRAGITISQIIIQASSEGEGRAAARGFAEELTRRGLLPVGV